MELVLNITTDGKVKSLYKDELRPIFDKLGKLTIPGRASDVIFDEAVNGWVVYELLDNNRVKRLPETFKHRKDAINYEVEYLQQKYL